MNICTLMKVPSIRSGFVHPGQLIRIYERERRIIVALFNNAASPPVITLFTMPNQITSVIQVADYYQTVINHNTASYETP